MQQQLVRKEAMNLKEIEEDWEGGKEEEKYSNYILIQCCENEDTPYLLHHPLRELRGILPYESRASFETFSPILSFIKFDSSWC